MAWAWIAALLMALPAAAAEPRLPLARGSYLPAELACARATPASIRHFDGQGFARGGTACLTTGLRAEGDGFSFTETCRHLATGAETSAPVRLFPEGDSAFTRDGVRYRRCPPEQLPAGLRGG